jgi:hypothetical protein
MPGNTMILVGCSSARQHQLWVLDQLHLVCELHQHVRAPHTMTQLLHCSAQRAVCVSTYVSVHCYTRRGWKPQQHAHALPWLGSCTTSLLDISLHTIVEQSWPQLDASITSYWCTPAASA